MLKISKSERQYIIEGIAANVRADGRSRLDYRNMAIETSILSQSNGSARVSLENSGTDILASVKLEVVSPQQEAPNAGIIQVLVACSPSVSAKLSGRVAEELNVELSQQMTRLLCSCPMVDLEKYVIAPGESVWSIHIDVTVFESTGNLPDLMSMAIYAALNDTVFPAVRVVGVEGEDKTIEVESDPAAGTLMNAVNWPICVTLCKVGDNFITDPMQEEELCMTAQVSVSVDAQRNVCGVQKNGTGALEMDEMQQMVDEGCDRSKELFRALHHALEIQRQRDVKHGHKVERLGFLA